jgi:uncharacterized protein YlxP (DUF503 family)
VVVGVARVVLHLPGAQSLKDKRQVMKSVLAQVQRRFLVAAAEVDHQDQWQIGVIGIACVSTDAAHADEVLARAVSFVEERAVDAQILEYQTEIAHIL